MTQAAVQLSELLRRMTVGYRLRSTLLTLAEEALGLIPLLIALPFLVRSPWSWMVIGLLLIVVALRGLWLFWRSALDPREADRRLELGDRLPTWIALRDRESAAVGWLEGQLVERLDADPGLLGKRVARRRLRWTRALLACVLAILLAWLLLMLLSLLMPPSEGPVDLPSESQVSQQGEGGGGQGEGTPEPGEPGESPPAEMMPPPEPQPSEPPPSEPPPPEEPPPEEEPEDEGGEPDPRELLEDPATQDNFVVPQFIGEDDGEGEMSTAPVALVDEGGGEGQAAQPPEASGGAGGEAGDEAEDRQYERALERALRSRHVPEEERPFVRRWFNSLIESPK